MDERLRALFASHPAALEDPYPLYAELREQAPVHVVETVVVVSRYADAKAVLNDDGVRFSKARMRVSRRAREARAALTDDDRTAFDELGRFTSMFISGADGAAHDRVRKIAQRAFTAARMAALQVSIQERTHELIGGLRSDRVSDLTTVADTLPLVVIYDLLGVPLADRDLLHDCLTRFRRNQSVVGAVDPVLLRDACAAVRTLQAYVEELLAARATSGNEILAILADAGLGSDELAALLAQLVLAGHETSANLIGPGLLELLRNRDQWERLCDDPSLAPRATEELLRYVTPAHWMARVTAREVELSGTTIGPGEQVLSLMASANRDPDAFAEPDRLDIGRRDSRKHLAFGFGPHFCLGAPLARYEANAVFVTLARRFPDTELAAETFSWGGYDGMRRLNSLPVRLGRER